MILISIFAVNSFAQTLEGNVVKVFDGDTVQFRSKAGKYFRLRLQGIDAPERRQTSGIECANELSSLTFGITVTAQLYGKDSYNRFLGRIGTEEIPDLNLHMIEIGCAWEYSAPLAVKTLYQTKEAESRDNSTGLWSDVCPTEPWSYRASGYKTCE